VQTHIQVYVICTGRKFKTASVEKDLLKRYFENTASSEEMQKVNSWLADTSKRPEILAWIESYWKEERRETAPVPAFEEMFGEALAAEKQDGKIIALRKSRRIWAYAAAASLVFFAVGVWMGNYMKKRSMQDTSKWVLSSAQTGKGQRAQLLLSDGSEVYLNAESELMFPSEVTLHPVVYLKGEAYFKMKDTSSSLVIKTKEIVARAKGGQINVSAFPSDSTVTISVDKGKAEIDRNRETWPMLKIRPIKKKDSATSVILEMKDGDPRPLVRIRKPVVVRENEQMTFNKNNGSTDVSMHIDDEISDWKDGKLVFYQAGEKEITDKLERRYGLKVIFTVPLEAGEHYTGEFKNASLQEVLTAICKTMHLECRIYSDVIYLIKK
jgi:ferric-dicitrate binding protein FerR (iron transport regulator)